MDQFGRDWAPIGDAPVPNGSLSLTESGEAGSISLPAHSRLGGFPPPPRVSGGWRRSGCASADGRVIPDQESRKERSETRSRPGTLPGRRIGRARGDHRWTAGPTRSPSPCTRGSRRSIRIQTAGGRARRPNDPRRRRSGRGRSALSSGQDGGMCPLRSLEGVQSAGCDKSGSRRWIRVSIRARRSFTSPNRRSTWTRKSATETCSWTTAPTSTTMRATINPAQRFRQPFPLLMLPLWRSG